MIKAVPTNIITGFLGTGKTTTLNHLLTLKPTTERWAILVNEFGELGVDASLLNEQNSDTLTVREIAGGCVCCVNGPLLPVTLNKLLKEASPDRLLIEPTGIGHPAGIVDTLLKPPFSTALQLQSILCLVDPRCIDRPEILQHRIFHDQLQIADVIVLNHCDLASSERLDEARELSRNMFPEKQAIVETVQGEIPLSLLELPSHSKASPLNLSLNFSVVQQGAARIHQPLAFNSAQPSATGETRYSELPLSKDMRCQFTEHHDDELYSYGWLFPREISFKTDEILALLNGLESRNPINVARIKANIRIGAAWVAYNRSYQDPARVEESSWRRDSRIELLSFTEISDPQALYQQLITTLRA